MSDAERAICPVCKSRQTDDFRDVREYHFQICAACRFVFLHPMPSEMVLDSMYNTGGQITPDFYPKAKSRLHRALRIAMHLYRFAWRGPVLDVGCGGGFQVEAFRRFGMRPTGLDISANSIAFARNAFSKNDFYCEKFEEFELKTQKTIQQINRAIIRPFNEFAFNQGKRSIKADTFLSDLSSFEENDLIVHANHGIGKFRGLKKLEVL